MKGATLMNMTLPAYVGPSSGTDIPIRVLCSDLQNYAKLPEFHRERVWSLRQEQRLIESLFLGKISLEIRVTRKGNRYEVLDGHQQIATVVRFYNDGFATARAKDDPRQSFPVQSNKRRSQLSEQSKDFFDNLIVRLRYRPEDEYMEEWEAADLYRRLNSQRALSKVDRLWSYPSQTHDRTKELLDHVFWQEIYAGNQDRSHKFRSALYMMFLESHQSKANMSERVMREFAAGKNDDVINSELVAGVSQHLDDIMHLFSGISLTKINEIIPVYQAVQLLSARGINVKSSVKGCLTSWYQGVQDEFQRSRERIWKTKILRCFTQESYQGDFWKEHLQKMFENNGLCLLDLRRNFTKEDIRKALERQRGLCARCDKPIITPFDGHHIVAYKEGGPTNVENCEVLHTDCHKDYHAGLEVKLAFFVLDSNIS